MRKENDSKSKNVETVSRLAVLEKLKITVNEFNFICDIQKGIIPELSELYCKVSIIDNMIVSSERQALFEKHNIHPQALFTRFLYLSYQETLSLLNEVDVYWEVCEQFYDRFNMKSPSVLLCELKGEHIVNYKQRSNLVFSDEIEEINLEHMPMLKALLINYTSCVYQENAHYEDEYLKMEYYRLRRDNLLQDLFVQELLDNTSDCV